MQENMTRAARFDLKAKSDGLKVFIERHCWTKMHGWCKAANSEVSGLGLAYITDEGHFYVYEVFLPRQKCSSGYTELDDDAVGKLNYFLHRKKKNATHLRFWWHTHYNFGVFWSGTDDNTAQTLMKGNGEWELSLVINQNGNWLCRADFMKPVNVTFDELPVFLVNNEHKRKRKRNFKSDIRRWVRPMYEPQTQFVKQDTSFHFGGQARWYEDWLKSQEKKGSESHFKRDDKKGCVCVRESGIYVFNPNCSVCAEEKKVVPFGKYVIFNGRTMTREKAEALQNCLCKHTGGWEDCQCTAECDECIERLQVHMGYEY